MMGLTNPGKRCELGQTHSLIRIGLSAIEIELTEALGVKVDLRTAQELSPYF